mgnify:CR=1 FL=1
MEPSKWLLSGCGARFWSCRERPQGVRVRIVALKAWRCFFSTGYLSCPIDIIIFATLLVRFLMNCPSSWLTSPRPYGVKGSSPRSRSQLAQSAASHLLRAFGRGCIWAKSATLPCTVEHPTRGVRLPLLAEAVPRHRDETPAPILLLIRPHSRHGPRAHRCRGQAVFLRSPRCSFPAQAGVPPPEASWARHQPRTGTVHKGLGGRHASPRWKEQEFARDGGGETT